MRSRPVDVVFVHGLFSSAEVWVKFTQLISADPDLDFVRVHCFEYKSPFAQIRPTRRIATIDDIADYLGTYLQNKLPDAKSIVLVSHSQGGLIVQRFLARMLSDRKGRDLARIKRVMMYACPNSGSEFLLGIRKLMRLWHHPQERQLRPYEPKVTETQRMVLRSVVDARGVSDTQCHIEISAYGGAEDNIVKPASSNWVFSSGGMLPGDHFAVVQPGDHQALSYQVLKAALTAVEAPQDEGARYLGDATAERQGFVSVEPPWGRRAEGRLHGREAISAAVLSGTGPRVHVLAGLDGSGKSRLALEIAEQSRRAGRQVWWVSVVRINSYMREVANQLRIPEGEVEQAWRGATSAPDLVWRALEASSQPWLLIFDNVDDPAELATFGGRVADATGWLRPPLTPHGMVLVTSRDQSRGTWGDWCRIHQMKPLEPDDGAAMLMESLGNTAGTFSDARELSKELGGLPLALRCAADYIRYNASQAFTGGVSVRTMKDYQVAVKQRFEAAAGAGHPERSLGLERVQEVFGLSLDLLTQRGLTAAAPLLKLFACLSIARIPYPVLLADEGLPGSPLLSGFTPAYHSAVLNGLSELGLIELQTLDGIEDQRLSHVLFLHPVVHGELRDDLDVQRRRTEYYGLNVQMLLSATKEFDPDYMVNWPTWNSVVPHAVEVARATLLGGISLEDMRVIVDALELARLTSRYLIAAGLIGPATDLLVEPVIAQCESFGFGVNDREILGLRHERGRIYLERGDPVAAEQELALVVAERVRLLGRDHRDTLASRHKVARAILEQGRWPEAETELRSVVAAERHVRGEVHPDTMVVRHSLARSILAQRNRQAEAEVMLREILAIRYREFPRTTPETLFVRHSLAKSLLEQGVREKWDEAEAELGSALNDVADRLDLPVVMRLRQYLALAKLQLGRGREAIADLEQVIPDQERVLGMTHPETEESRTLLKRARDILDNSP